MATNDFLPFAAGGGANVLTQAQYAALTSILANGFSSGTAISAQLNKVWRQSSLMSAVLGALVADITNQNVVDDGSTATILSNLMAAVMQAGYKDDSGTVNAYVVTLSPAPLAYYDGMRVSFSTVNTNTSTAPTLNVNGLGAITITQAGGTAVDVGSVIANAPITMVYNSTGPRFEILGMIPFLQYGTGAVPKTQQQKSRERVSIFDFMTAAEIADAKTGTPTIDTVTKIQAAIDSLPLGAIVDVNTGTPALPRVLGGGGYVDFCGADVMISAPLQIPDNVEFVGHGSIVPDPTGNWTNTSLDCLDRIEITGSAGTGYPDSFTVTMSGGGFTTLPTATGYARGGVIQYFIVNTEGVGGTSAPTLDLSAAAPGLGGVTGVAVATAYLKERKKPLITNKVRGGVYGTNKPDVGNITLKCNGISDGIEWNVVYGNSNTSPTIFNPVYDAIRYISCDIGGTHDIRVYSPGHYGIWARGTSVSGCNEQVHVNPYIVYAGKACIKTTSYCEAIRVVDGSLTANIGGVEIIAGGGTNGDIYTSKIEHDAGNPMPMIVVATGYGHQFDINMAPRTPTVFYKWLHNSSAFGVTASFSAPLSVLSSRIDNPVLVNDISPFQSDVTNGLIVLNPPYGGGTTKLAKITDWCRGTGGVNQTASFKMPRWFAGLSSGLQIEKIDCEGTLSTSYTQSSYVVGDTFRRRGVQASGEVLIGSGSAAADIRKDRRASVQTVDATVTTLDSFTIAAGQVVMWKASVIASDAANAAHAAYEITGSAYLLAGVATLIGTPVANSTFELNAAMNATIDVAGATIRVRVTGLAATTINWVSDSTILVR